MARQMSLSAHTIQDHLKSIFAKTEASDRITLLRGPWASDAPGRRRGRTRAAGWPGQQRHGPEIEVGVVAERSADEVGADAHEGDAIYAAAMRAIAGRLAPVLAILQQAAPAWPELSAS